MLDLRMHLSLLAMSFLTWGLFVILGLPDYYQHWPLLAQLLILPAVTALYVPLTPWLLHRFPTRDHRRNALWLALYLTLPLFIYDVVYIVVIGGDTPGFVLRYWYLSFFYVSFWIQFPWLARRMKG
jgi:hypothetical protein